MGYPLRVETAENACLTTSRTRNSELWLVNNEKLLERLCAYLAKYSTTREVELYAAGIEGNHIHMLPQFPKANRGDFMRDFNTQATKLTQSIVLSYPGGPMWARRYAEQAIPDKNDIEEWFFYIALQPVSARLCERIGDYDGYNSFHDAVCGIEKKFKTVRYAEYRKAKKRNPRTNIADYTEEYKLRFKRLPGYEDLSQEEYCKLMHEKLEARRVKLVNEIKATGYAFPEPDKIRATKPGSAPRHTKTSTRDSFRPLVLARSLEVKQDYLSRYFGKVIDFRSASVRFRAGELTVEFPEGTYRPHLLTSPMLK